MSIHPFEHQTVYLLTASAIWTRSGHWHRPGWLVVEKNRVVAIGSGPPPALEAAVAVHLESLVLTPGLIDAHVHLALNPGGLENLEARVDLAVNNGLAGVRDGGDRWDAVLNQRAEMSRRLRVAASGHALFRQGRYGSFIGQSVRDAGDIKMRVREAADAGADQIKVLASGLVDLNEFGRVGPVQFSGEELDCFGREARDAGLKLMVHANGPEAVSAAVRAGAFSIEHGYFMGDAALALLADSGCTWVPTIEPLAALAREDAPRRSLIQRIIDRQVDQLHRAKILGVKVAVGTDAGSPGVPAGPSLYREAAWFKKAGFDGDAFLKAAVTEGAALLDGRSDGLHLEPGSDALVLGFRRDQDGSPLLDEPPCYVGRTV